MKHVLSYVPLLLAFLFLPRVACAQDDLFKCGSEELWRMGSLFHNTPEELAGVQHDQQALESFTQSWIADPSRGGNGPYVIPVVFHIIHNNGVENISDAQVEDAVRILNLDFNKLNTDWEDVRPEFLDIVANVGVTFRLAHLDPDGNCTKGITRTVSERTADGDQDMKNLIQWPREKYLNIWVSLGAGGAAGYTYNPGTVNNWAAADGIVILHDYTGSIGTSSPGHSRALSHEVGHWINLKHTWGGTNDPGLAENCGSSDNVDDTPQTIGWTTCNLNGATCGSALDNVENYMEYAYCQKMFTEGQKARMIASLNSGTADRSNLWTPENLAATGVTTTPVLCAAGLISNKHLVCAGGDVQFTDVSYNGVTAWTWSFAGATPAISHEQNPLVTYTEPGTYPVSLTVYNGDDSIEVTEPSFVEVLPLVGVPLPFTEDVESITSLPSSMWSTTNPGLDGGFELSTSAAYSGTHSFRMRNFGNEGGLLDQLTSNTIDVTGDTLPIITFRYAYVQRTSDNDDMLRIYISRDCGQNWNLRRQLRGTLTLPTAPDQNSVFTPNGPDQWGYQEIGNIYGNNIVTDFRIRFEFLGDGGNDLWLDDININGTPLGFGELPGQASFAAQVLPNPANDQATVVANLTTAGAVSVELLDPVGRVVKVVANDRRSAGAQRWNLPLEGLPAGLYLVRLQQQDAVSVVRFTRN